MARRSDHNSEELKELAITKALKLIEEKGEAGFKARAIAKEMGYTVGTLYYLFGDLGQFRLHVCGRLLDMHYDEITREIARKKNRLDYHIIKYLQYAQNRPNFSKFLYTEKVGTRNEKPEWYLEKYKKHYALFIETFKEVIKDKKLALKAGNTIWAHIHGVCILLLTDKLPMLGVSSPESMIRHLVKNYLDGLKH